MYSLLTNYHFVVEYSPSALIINCNVCLARAYLRSVSRRRARANAPRPPQLVPPPYRTLYLLSKTRSDRHSSSETLGKSLQLCSNFESSGREGFFFFLTDARLAAVRV